MILREPVPTIGAGFFTSVHQGRVHFLKLTVGAKSENAICDCGAKA